MNLGSCKQVLRSSYTMRTKCAISDAFVRDCVFAYCASVAHYVYSLSAEHFFRLRNNAISDERVRDCALSTHSVSRPLHRYYDSILDRIPISVCHETLGSSQYAPFRGMLKIFDFAKSFWRGILQIFVCIFFYHGISLRPDPVMASANMLTRGDSSHPVTWNLQQ